MNHPIICPSCGGKGHVFNALTLLVIPFGMIMGPFERNNPEGFTREECGQCGGTGFIQRPLTKNGGRRE